MTRPMSSIDPIPHLRRVHETAPLIHNITNFVAMNAMANVLLAIGASPAMVHAREEAAEFAGLAQALTINIGTLSPHWVDAMLEAARAANAVSTPWVMDPVAVGATHYRRQTAKQLIELSPSVIRGNASEIIALAGQSSTGRGVDSTDAYDDAIDSALQLARQTGAVVAVTGEQDLVTDGQRLVRVAGGHPLMPKVTTLGCSLTGVVAAFIAAAEDTLAATVAALCCYATAGELAGGEAKGPGSFAVAFIDALHALDAQALEGRHLDIEHV
ncbi:hydroxyethylthiazole kinase [Halomonas salinarum]|uniref:hydroxyethylthiazole kinase n=1 Tax=Halomonas salinarum TaxID=1158993 RepID=UPI001FD73A1A|nr:hydroxyethylthiazole kinase [Halomonas salinarum]